MSKVTRITDVITDEDIDRIIRKYSTDPVVYWDRVIETVTAEIEGKEIRVPSNWITLGIPGAFVGLAYYIWWYIRLDALTTVDKLESYIRESLKNMHQKKTEQLLSAKQNGQIPNGN